MMKLYIRPEALYSENKTLLPSGALYGMKTLLEADYELAFDDSELSNSQKALLKNEQIESSNFDSESADGTISRETGGKFHFTASRERIEEQPSWGELTRSILFPSRKAELKRTTKETDITVKVNLDGTGKSDISTGLNFFDHMLDQIARHGLIDLELSCKGDLEVDEHHTIEDTAIALGQVIRKAISGNKAGIQRYAFVLPMDEARATVAIDLSDRPYLKWGVDLKREYVGDFPTEMLEHFYHTIAMNAGCTLHVEADGNNEHHIIEAVFKGFARSLRFAVSRNERIRGILPTTKGQI